MTPDLIERIKRAKLIDYLVAHVYESQPYSYQDNARAALAMQSTPNLVAMAKSTRAAEWARKEKARLARARRVQHEHTR